MKEISMLLTNRNTLDFLKLAVKSMRENASNKLNELIIMDDGSTDDTVGICERLPYVSEVVRGRENEQDMDGCGFWGRDETNLRSRLWRVSTEHAGADGWIYIFDADHLLTGITPDDFRTLCRADHVNAWAFRLLDCWEARDRHRVDGFWQAWLHPRTWLLRGSPEHDFQPVWETRGIHAGHIPANYPLRTGIAPGFAAIQHLGYVSAIDRAEKAQKYLDLGVSE
ncbi:hypothetical protein LCGC14_2919510 [marine sediment metagenome]|uniref:Glycosyltransferase 2-like domain-containing protein n=1 Tax=marine sediment metagenome TaxID=412755 RepID=A0A0F8XPJ9_9ZZZZ